MDHNGSKAIRLNRVRELRENRLMTQAQLARKAKVALRTIHSVEKGMNCRMDTKRKILLALGLRFEDKDQVFPSLSLFGSDSVPPALALLSRRAPRRPAARLPAPPEAGTLAQSAAPGAVSRKEWRFRIV